MKLPSQQYLFDNRLLTVEELFIQIRQRDFGAAQQELEKLDESDFSSSSHELGAYCTLKAEACFYNGNYPKALEYGLRGAKLLADLPLNRRYGRALFVLSLIHI